MQTLHAIPSRECRMSITTDRRQALLDQTMLGRHVLASTPALFTADTPSSSPSPPTSAVESGNATAAAGDDCRVEMAAADAGEAAAWWNTRVYFDGKPVRRFDLAQTLGSRPDMNELVARRLLESAEEVGGPSGLAAPWQRQEPAVS